MKRTLVAVVTSVTAIGAVVAADGMVASAERPSMCVSVNGDVKVQHGTAECSSVASDGAANVARVKGEHSVAIAGLTEGHYGNKAMVNGDRSYAEAGSRTFLHFRGDDNTAMVFGNDSTAVATDGSGNTAIVRGDRSEANIAGSICKVICSVTNWNTATVIGDDSTARISLGSHNTASVTGDRSYAGAGEGQLNAATVIGDDSSATAGRGSGQTATVIGDGSRAHINSASGGTAEVYSDDASAYVGPPRPIPPQSGYACADEPGEHAVNEDLCD
jgi:hypothetical protein